MKFSYGLKATPWSYKPPLTFRIYLYAHFTLDECCCAFICMGLAEL